MVDLPVDAAFESVSVGQFETSMKNSVTFISDERIE
jgi:hypothetical protein